MSDTLLSKGLMFGECFTTGCDNSGSTVKGVAGQASMWSPDARHQHRCESCHRLIRGVLETALSYVKLDTGIEDDHQAAMDATYVAVGKQILAMDLDQLRGAKL